MIRIGFVIDTIESSTAGTEKQLLMLLANLDRSRFQPFLFVLRDGEWLRENWQGCPVYEVGVRSFFHPGAYLNILKLARLLRRLKIDLVQTHFMDGNAVGVLAGTLARVKVVSTRRNQGYWHTPLRFSFQKLLNRFVDRFLANCESTKLWLAQTEMVAPGRIEVIGNALDVARFGRHDQGVREEFRSTLGLSTDAQLVGIVANLRPVKGIDTFIRAARLVHDSCPNARFLVVGEGEERKPLEQLCEQIGIASKILFLGRREDIPYLLGCLDVGVLSSVSESFSNSILEYLASGLPVVATDTGGVREAISEGDNGFVVPVGDHAAMASRITLILSGALADHGREAEEALKKRYSVDAIMRRYETFYSEIAAH